MVLKENDRVYVYNLAQVELAKVELRKRTNIYEVVVTVYTPSTINTFTIYVTEDEAKAREVFEKTVIKMQYELHSQVAHTAHK